MEPEKQPQSLTCYVLSNCVLGGLIGLMWGLLILATDTAGLRGLVIGSAYPAATLILFLLGSVIAIMPIVLAAAIGRLAE